MTGCRGEETPHGGGKSLQMNPRCLPLESKWERLFMQMRGLGGHGRNDRVRRKRQSPFCGHVAVPARPVCRTCTCGVPADAPNTKQGRGSVGSIWGRASCKSIESNLHFFVFKSKITSLSYLNPDSGLG